MESIFRKSVLPDEELRDGIIFQRFDLSTGEFAGCTHLLFDGEQLVQTSVTGQDQELISVDELRRDDSGKSMVQIYQEQRSKYSNNPITKHRRLRKQLKKKR